MTFNETQKAYEKAFDEMLATIKEVSFHNRELTLELLEKLMNLNNAAFEKVRVALGGKVGE